MNFKIKTSRLFIGLLYCAVTITSCNNDNQSAGKINNINRDTLPNKEVLNPYATHDQSPMDMSYYPPNYPVLRMNGTDSSALVARVVYSRPQKKGRIIFGSNEKSLCIYGKEWRLGANEATEIEFFKTITVNGKKIEKGRYVIYCIPFADKWQIILNNNLYTWGLHMDASKDIFKTEIPVQEQIPAVEDFSMIFEPSANGANLIMAWDNVKTTLPFSFSK